MPAVDLTEMTETEAVAVAADLVKELEDVREEVDRVQRRAVGIRKMIDALVEMFPAAEDVLPDDLDPDEEPRPRGAEAVYRVLAERPGSWAYVENVLAFLGSKDWLPDSSNPSKAVRTALERAHAAGRLEKGRSKDTGGVIYRVAPVPGPKKTPAKSASSSSGAGGGYGFDEEPF